MTEAPAEIGAPAAAACALLHQPQCEAGSQTSLWVLTCVQHVGLARKDEPRCCPTVEVTSGPGSAVAWRTTALVRAIDGSVLHVARRCFLAVGLVSG